MYSCLANRKWSGVRPLSDISQTLVDNLSLSRNVKFSTDSKDLSVISAKFYKNTDTQKLQILVENQGKAGVYRFKNLLNGKSYIGSSINLSRRFREYYSIQFLEREIKSTKMRIYRGLLKYGYSSFSLEILEYCDKSETIKREQYYLNLLKPEYNIPLRGSRFNLPRRGKHTEESLAKMSEANKKREKHPMFGKQHSKETLAKMSISKIGLYAGENNPMFGRAGEKHPMFGKPRPDGSGRPAQKIEVIDTPSG